MKRVWLYMLLCVETAFCIIAALLVSPEDTGGLMAAAEVPFAQAGLLLRSMSLSGGAGNAVAFVLYIIICCVPAALLFIRLIKKRAKAEDALLAALSGYLFYLMYMMINPANIGSTVIGPEWFGKSVLAGIFWSLLVGWLVLKLLRIAKERDTASILKMLGVLFALASMFIVFFAAYGGVSDLRAGIKALETANTGTPGNIAFDPGIGNYVTNDALMPTKAFLVFRYIIGLIPIVTDILILLMAKTLTQQLKIDRYSLDVVNTSGRLASLCKYTVVIIVISSVSVNLLQLMFSGSLRSINFNWTIPLGSIILALGMLLLSRYFAESRKIKRENEMFV